MSQGGGREEDKDDDALDEATAAAVATYEHRDREASRGVESSVLLDCNTQLSLPFCSSDGIIQAIAAAAAALGNNYDPQLLLSRSAPVVLLAHGYLRSASIYLASGRHWRPRDFWSSLPSIPRASHHCTMPRRATRGCQLTGLPLPINCSKR